MSRHTDFFVDKGTDDDRLSNSRSDLRTIRSSGQSSNPASVHRPRGEDRDRRSQSIA
jgi:hypothetical protein